MRYFAVAFGTYILTVSLIAVRAKMGWSEGFESQAAELVLWMAFALVLAKTVLRQSIRRVPVGFREIVIIISMVFATILTNASINYVQQKAFNGTWIPYYGDPKPKPPGFEKPVVPTVTEKIATNFVSVAGEEISSRWIVLGALLMVMPSGWAIVLSSVLFALLHTVIPIMGGRPEIGLNLIGPTGAIGVFCGIAFVRYGLAAAIAIHFLVNLLGWFAYNQTYIAKTVIFGSAFVAMIVLPLTLWFTRGRRQRARFTGQVTV